MLDEPTQLKQREAVAEGPPIGAAATSGPQTRALLRVIFVILAVAAALWALYALEAVLLLVALAIFSRISLRRWWRSSGARSCCAGANGSCRARWRSASSTSCCSAQAWLVLRGAAGPEQSAHSVCARGPLTWRMPGTACRVGNCSSVWITFRSRSVTPSTRRWPAHDSGRGSGESGGGGLDRPRGLPAGSS